MDVLTGQNAQVDVLGVSWGFRTREQLVQAGAKHIIDSPHELITKFQSM